MRRLAPVSLLVLLSSCTSAPPPSSPDISADRISAHVRFLADDLLEPRCGLPRRGARHPLHRFALEPLGDNGSYYQGADVKGKLVVLFTNESPSSDPKFFGGAALTCIGRYLGLFLTIIHTFA